MQELKFTIIGNQEKETGNPIPYLRVTGKQCGWLKGPMRYKAWKDFVVEQFLAQNPDTKYKIALFHWKKPVKLGDKIKAKMSLRIFWKDGAHADPDNIFKGIGDALFVNDKELDCNTDSVYSEDKVGRVEVSILIFD